MKLKVNASLCQGHGRCYALAPALFDLDENGHATARNIEINDSNRERAELAKLNCPENAIAME